MIIKNVQIKNFRSLSNVSVTLRKTNILLGPNNCGKTSFLEALNYAIGWDRKPPQEDDFFVDDTENFDPQKAEPIEVILDFYEGFQEHDRFSETITQTFDGVIQYDESIVKEGEEPIKFLRLKYTYGFDVFAGKYIEKRSFLDRENNIITGKNTYVKKEHLTFFPYFYLETMRDIKKEMRSKSSFWGKLKGKVDYSHNEKRIKRLISLLDQLLVKKEEKLNELVLRLKDIQKSIKISDDEDNVYLQALSSRNWELLDGLNLYLKTSKSNISLPIDKHGMGTQNIITLIIFNSYLSLLLPEIIENPETTPIVGIEEPEAHVYPHSQRAMFEQLCEMSGQKIISTHSPYIVDQADIHDYILFSNHEGKTEIKCIPEYKKNFNFKYGLPPKAYESNAFFGNEDIHVLKRYIQFKNTELLFSSVFLMCEGDSEKIFFEMISPKYLSRSLGRSGVSIISCDGQAYSNFLKISNKDALNIPWLIFSDGEDITMNSVKACVLSNGYSQEDLQKKVIFLPNKMDFEEYYINWLGEHVLENIIEQKYGNQALSIFIREEKKKIAQDITITNKEFINKFIDAKGKTIFGEYVAEYVINTTDEADLPSEIRELFRRLTDY
ncbi:ATP-dependent nuclease [Paenibacillus phytohabitans]|uniref:ATP-dependent nuclease n=1 Tax=Paenibacillus phytohabitans TaxID=2654978 RepID=UPI00300B9384